MFGPRVSLFGKVRDGEIQHVEVPLIFTVIVRNLERP